MVHAFRKSADMVALLAAILAAGMLLGCPTESQGVCDGVTCSDHGRCQADQDGFPICVCDPHYEAFGLACVEKKAPCGNGIVDSGEDCDGTNLNGTTCRQLHFDGGTLLCNDNCTFDTSQCITPPNCGDGMVDPGEDCDGTNLNGTTCLDLSFAGGPLSCNDNCTFDTSQCITPPNCGNGTVDSGEDCDGTNLNGTTCQQLNFDGGELACRQNCTFDTSGCHVCGNGIVESNENCDGTNLNSTTCQQLDFDGGELACRQNCTFDTSGCYWCGNGMVDPGEECDGTNLNNNTCQTRGFSGGTLSCNTNCTFDTSHCTTAPVCGNGILETGEACDSTNVGIQTCYSVAHMHHGQLRCVPDCSAFDTSDCHECGNGTLEGPEVCEPGMTCQDLGFSGGQGITCTDECQQVDISLCWTCGDGTCSENLGETSSRCPMDCGAAASITAGLGYACSVKNDGTGWCWGMNNHGQLGNNSTTNSNVPVQVSGISNFLDIQAGGTTGGLDNVGPTCGLDMDGQVWCWGRNDHGQVGDGTTTDRSAPVPVSGLNDAAQVSAGANFACALKQDGTVWCWGDNRYGQLGDGTTTDQHTPVQVSGLTQVVQVSCGNTGYGGGHVCAVKNDRTVWCWGNNELGELGDGTTTESLVPVQVPNLTNVGAIITGYHFTCALKRDGTVWCWGENARGELGDGTTTDRHSPVRMVNLTDVVALGEGSGATEQVCVIDSHGAAWCSGRNDWGQLGDGTTTDRHSPTQVANLTNVVAVATGYCFSCAVTSDGKRWCWGRNTDGQLGEGTNTTRHTPTQVSGSWP